MATFELFKSIFKGDIVEPSSPEYPKALARWAKNAERNARYVLFPKDEQDVSEAIKFAVTNNLPLAVKGGGHNPSGASSVEDGVSIDLNRYLDTARVDPDKKLAYVGGGALWKTVDYAAIEHGLATPGGTVNHTGVGGLTLGGGFGYLSGRHGLTIDNVVQATIVLADGSIVTASETSHSDLFWAIRGGGGNFGVVTEFVFKLHPQRRTVFAGLAVFPPPVLEQVVATVDRWWSEAREDEMIMLAFTRGPDSSPSILVILFYNGSEEEGRQRFKPLFDIEGAGPVLDTAREIPYEHLNELLNATTVHGRRCYMTGTSLRSTLSTNATQVFKRVMELSEKHPTDPSRPPFQPLIIYELLPNHNICKVSPDAMAYRSRGPQANVVVAVIWDEEENDINVKHARAFHREIAAIITASAERELKEYENEGYGNYATDPTDLQTKSLQLWGNNYPRLQKIKHKYDPTSTGMVGKIDAVDYLRKIYDFERLPRVLSTSLPAATGRAINRSEAADVISTENSNQLTEMIALPSWSKLVILKINISLRSEVSISNPIIKMIDTSTTLNTKMSAFELFKSVFKGDIVEPSSPDYRKALARWAVNSERNARYVLFPKDEQDVSEAVKFATGISLPLAVKGGGHNPSGASSVEDGVSIDLNRYFDTARIDPEKKLAYVGGGALWKTVDYAAIEHGLATPGGTVNHTGVGGLTLGGGFGYLSGRHGLTIDNVVQATIVLADGSIVTASETSHPDLFWAIRGGGNNFGIVTEFVLKLHPQRRTVFGGIVVFPPPVLEQVVATIDQWWSEAREDEMIMFGFARGPHNQPSILAILFYNGSEEEGRQRFKPLFDIGTSLRSTISANAPNVFKRAMELSEKHPTDPSLPPFEIFINYELLPTQNICKVPADAMAYRSRGPQANVLVVVTWDIEEQDQADVKHARAFSREITGIVNASAERGLAEYENSGYGNYATDPTDMQTRSLQLWGNNYPRLQKIKHRYDPTSVFNRWIPIHPSP
ncbi:hypothetical protein Clacol_004128 [Clathrus columnatus]|uniref:FAD-binding PCMH-type domain-containing protein n=1 Tax=Clathrus columnatus TaxID=1419009 RepID=A0AAV5A9K8_9AGAM|nr:hypothetical protein Clacol_004128 [Clathrus columnatus]